MLEGAGLAVSDLSRCVRAAEPMVDPSLANCDFEDGGMCLYHQGQGRAEARVWSRVAVQPNAFRTGDHTTGTGESTRGRSGEEGWEVSAASLGSG